ncbi:ferredoxin [Candidatus Babeliales bacterium]|nr:ferredoxin [Candidatus Babeliales bacterium]
MSKKVNNLQIKEVKISPGCISCGTCQVVCPEVFQVNDVCSVKEGVDLNEYEECISEAEQMCPVGAISIQRQATESRGS